jgi:sugar phosphate isomerase/epimerase
MTHRDRIGLAVGNFDAESLAAKVRMSADMGYNAVEVHGRFLADTPPDDLAEVERLLSELDLLLTVHTGFASTHGMCSPSETVARTSDILDWHAKMGRVACISYDVPWKEIAPGMYRTDPTEIAAAFEEVLRISAGRGVPIALEDWPLDEESLSAHADWVEKYPHWTILLDLGHMNMLLREPKHDPQPLEPNAVESYIRRIPLAIAETHIHSNDGSEDQHLPPYMGNTEFEAALRALDEVGFEGIHTIEIVPGPDGLPRKEIPAAARKSILYWRNFLNGT